MFTVYYADILGKSTNCSYPHKVEITGIESLKKSVSFDYVCAEYKDNYRNINNFIGSNCLPVDCDNDHSDNPSDWVTPDDVKEAFPDVSFAIHYSRNHNKDKGEKKARPKFHVLFPIDYITDPKAYSEIKRKVIEIFPYFDKNASDAARFFFGTENPVVEIIEGNINLTEFLKSDDEIERVFEMTRFDTSINEGSRNSTMSKYAGKIIKRYGDTPEAYDHFIEQSKRCNPPLEDNELSTIWNSAKKFYVTTILKDASYIAPEMFNSVSTPSYKPGDYSDVGQAEVLAKHFKDKLRYSPSTHYLRYRNNYWQETEPGAQGIAHELTRLQLKESSLHLMLASKEMDRTGASAIIASKLKVVMNNDQLEAYEKYLEAKKYHSFVINRRDSKNITATLKESRPILEISPADLDHDPFLLCTPKATYDLRQGMNGARKHSPDDFITKITAVSPSDKGKKLWLDSLDLIFQKNQELIDYVQLICGLAVIGKVFLEALIIAWGEGNNGKSTFWNTVSRVLGLYSGNISADTLTVGCKRNIKPELAEVRSKRLLIAAESKEGDRLNDSTVKQLCSTDDIFAEKKYKDPFSFKPCHTLILYTNHLPKVSSSDDGIWRRLIVIPFSAKITGKSDIKNYAEHLFDNAGEYVLAWIIEGAKKVIDLKYKIPFPKCVQDVNDAYKEQNDWFQQFLDEKCDVDSSCKAGSGELYNVYRMYCSTTNDYVRSTTDFYAALERNGFQRQMSKNKRYFKGLKIKPDTEDFPSLSSINVG